MTKELETFINNYEKELNKLKLMADTKKMEDALKQEAWRASWEVICKDIAEFAKVIKQLQVTDCGFRTGITSTVNQETVSELIILISDTGDYFTLHESYIIPWINDFLITSLAQSGIIGNKYFTDKKRNYADIKNSNLCQLVERWDVVKQHIEWDIMKRANDKLQQIKKDMEISK